MLGDGLSINGQSNALVQALVWLLVAEQELHASQFQVSAVHCGVQACVVAGDGVFTPGQSLDKLHVLVWEPLIEQVPQLEQVQVSAVQVGV